MTTVQFKYNLKSTVIIKSINTIGTVVGCYVGDSGTQYQVAYFLNGERKVTYLYSEELSSKVEKAKLGFNT